MLLTIELTPAQRVAAIRAIEEKAVDFQRRASQASDPGYVSIMEQRAAEHVAIAEALKDAEAA